MDINNWGILGEIAAVLRERPKMRRTVLIISGALLAVGVSAEGILVLSGESRVSPTNPFLLIPAILLGAVFSSALIAYLPEELINLELGTIRKEREKIRERIDNDKGVLDTIQLSLNQLSEYYTINKAQARRSFNFSVFAISLGLLILIVGIWIFYFSLNPNIRLATLTSVSGIFIQFIGGANFYIYNKSMSQLNMFYCEVIRSQNTMLAIELTAQISPDRQDAVKERLIDALMFVPGTVAGSGQRRSGQKPTEDRSKKIEDKTKAAGAGTAA